MGPPEGKDYKWYMNGKKPANWGMDYATDPTFYGNQKQPFTFFSTRASGWLLGFLDGRSRSCKGRTVRTTLFLGFWVESA